MSFSSFKIVLTLRLIFQFNVVRLKTTVKDIWLQKIRKFQLFVNFFYFTLKKRIASLWDFILYYIFIEYGTNNSVMFRHLKLLFLSLMWYIFKALSKWEGLLDISTINFLQSENC